jgi:hypothetical protein
MPAGCRALLDESCVGSAAGALTRDSHECNVSINSCAATYSTTPTRLHKYHVTGCTSSWRSSSSVGCAVMLYTSNLSLVWLFSHAHARICRLSSLSSLQSVCASQ